MQITGTSLLHIDLISGLRRINSLVCPVDYPLCDMETNAFLPVGRTKGKAVARKRRSKRIRSVYEIILSTFLNA